MQLPTVDDVRSKRDPAPTWRWIVQMPTDFVMADGSTNPFSSYGAHGGLGSKSKMPLIIVENFEFQSFAIDSDARFGGGIKVNYPRFLSMGSLNLTMFEDDRYTTTNYLKTWMRAVISPEGNYGMPVNYKRNIKFYAFDIISNTKPVFIGTFKDCWPLTGPTGMSYQYETSGHVTVNCEFACDKDEVEFPQG